MSNPVLRRDLDTSYEKKNWDCSVPWSHSYWEHGLQCWCWLCICESTQKLWSRWNMEGHWMKVNRILISVHAFGWILDRVSVALEALFHCMHHLRGVWMWVVVCLVQAPDLEADNSPQASPPLEVRLEREQAEQAVILRVKAMIPSVAAMQLCHALARWRRRKQLKSLKVKPLHHQLRRNLLCRAPNGVTWATVFLLRVEWFWAFSWMISDSFRVLYSCGRAHKPYRFNVGTAAGAFHQPAKPEQLSVLPAAHRLAHLLLEIYINDVQAVPAWSLLIMSLEFPPPNLTFSRESMAFTEKAWKDFWTVMTLYDALDLWYFCHKVLNFEGHLLCNMCWYLICSQYLMYLCAILVIQNCALEFVQERNLQVLSGGTVLEFRITDDKRWSTRYPADQQWILCWCDHWMGLVWSITIPFIYFYAIDRCFPIKIHSLVFRSSPFGFDMHHFVAPLKATSRSPRSSPKKEPFKPSSPSPRLITKPLSWSAFQKAGNVWDALGQCSRASFGLLFAHSESSL